jgi:tRNA A-37 threonylcarbamoyl transferase component Bud32
VRIAGSGGHGATASSAVGGAFELVVTVALAGLIVVYECRAVIGPFLPEDRIRAERIMKNVILLVSLVMLIDAIYVPKNWLRAAIMSSSLAMLPAATLAIAYLIYPGWVRWVGQPRADGNKPLAVFEVDTIFLLTLAAISSFVAHTISRLRSQVIEARRLGQYRLGERIGAGGMGEVFLAEHELLKRPCAVKLIRPEVVLQLATIDRFEREVRINATLSHPNTVEIFDYGRTEDGTYYYVMEYLPGMSLGDLVERHGPLPPARAVYLLRQVALALQEAHEAGLIHRDIKPSNIFAARRGGMDDIAKLLDFGLVRPAATARSPRTSDEDQILGTPHYMSPEQAMNSRPLDARSDIYSLGAVAYYLITGRPPFDAATAIEAIIAHARDPVVPPSQIRDDVPVDLDAVILRCLAKDPMERFPTAESLEIALGRCTCASSWDKALAKQWWSDLKLLPSGK